MCAEISELLGVDISSVREWVYDFCRTEKLAVSKKKNPAEVTLYPESMLTVPMRLELMYFLRDRQRKGLKTTAKDLQAHLNSTERLDEEFCSLANCPRVLISQDTIIRVLTQMGALSWAEMKSVGKIAYTEEGWVKRQARMKVFFTQWGHFRVAERESRVVIVQMDESFINVNHFSNWSLTTIGPDGKPEGSLNRPVGAGKRSCISGAITKFGPVTTHVGNEGIHVRDDSWTNGFQELDNKGNPRKPFSKSKGAALLAELHEECNDLGIVVTDVSNSVDGMKRLIKEYVGKSAVQAILVNFDKYSNKLDDMAKTTLKIYPATQGGIGDYHSNFDTAMFFKWMKSLLLTWSDHMKELHI